MTTLEVGTKLVELINAMDMATIYGTLYSPDIVSIESLKDGETKEFVGMGAMDEKNAEWETMFDMKSWKTEGPFPNGNEFALFFELELIHKASGQPVTMKEIALYTVVNDLIVRERFFYVWEN